MNRSRLAVALGVVVLLLSSCSDDPRPKVAPATHAPTVTEIPSPSVEAMTPEETVRAWVRAQNQAMRNGDTSEARALSSQPCEACDGLLDPIDKVYSAGGYFKTAGWRLDGLKLASNRDGHAVVNVAMTIQGGKTVNVAGAEPVVYHVDRSIMVFKLSKDERWLVSFIGFLS